MAVEVWRPRSELMRSPLRELARMEREMEEMFGRVFREWPWSGARGWGWAPPVDVLERDEEIVLRADLPGLEEKDIEVTVKDGVLTIRGEREEGKTEKGERYHACERPAGAFVRSLLLPAGVDPEKIKATFKNGVLEVHLHKTKAAKGRKIDIKVE